MNKNIVLLVMALWNMSYCYAQTCTATGATINIGSLVVKNIKTDFNAVGDGITDDHDAFKAAAACINNSNGNVKLIIPNGIYLVGRQTAHIGSATHDDPVYEGETVMFLDNINNLVIEGEAYSKIIYKDEMKFGTFDTATGSPNPDINLYNPLNPDTLAPNHNAYNYKYAGTIGTFIQIENSSNIEIKNLEINGNSDNYILGGNWGSGDRPIELKNSYGVFLHSITNSTFTNLKIHHFGVDNLQVSSSFTGGYDPEPVSTNLVFDQIICEYAGRNNFSWVGGENICVSNSAFNHAYTKIIKTKPGYGMDIEPEGDSAQVLCRNGFFLNNVYAFNGNSALTPGYSLDHPMSTYAKGKGFSYDHYFKKCILVGKTGPTVHNYINRVTYDSCSFYGQVSNYGCSIDATPPTVIKNSFFSDCYNGEAMYNQPLLSLYNSYKAQFLNNTFKRYFSAGEQSWIFQYDQSEYACDIDTYKPLIENSSFYFYPFPTASLQYASNARKTYFKNNSFYKDPSDNVRWYNIPGCPPDSTYGEGNVDLGDGFQYFDLVSNPVCEDPVCEASIYISYDLSGSKIFNSQSIIYADGDITLSSGDVVGNAEGYIVLNPGFETNLSNSAGVDLKIETCELPGGLMRNSSTPKNFPGLPANSQGEIKNDGLITVFPNPSNAQFTIRLNDCPKLCIVEYEVYNSLSQPVEKGTVRCANGKQKDIIIRQAVKPGIYYLKLRYGNMVYANKLIKL